MANRQFQVAGSIFADETGDRQFQVAGAVYLDSTFAPGSGTLKSLDTIVTASIKKINGISIASVKAYEDLTP